MSWLASGCVPQETDPDAEEPGRRAPCVQVAEVVSEMVTDELELRANLMASRQTAVIARSPGWISELRVDEGDEVVGDETVLATMSMEAQDLNVNVARAGIDMAEAQLNQARLQLEQARIELSRVQALREQGAATDQQLEQVQTTVATLEQLVNQADAHVRMLRTQLRQAQDLASDSEIRAPFDGVVAHRLVEVGQLITNFPPTPLFVLLDPSQIRVIANVPERYAQRVRVGIPATVILSDGTEMEGTLDHVSPDLDLRSRTLRVWTLLDNSDGRLRHGGSAVLRINLGQVVRPILPRHAITRVEGDRGTLFALNPDGRTVRQIEVLLGSLQDQHYPVLEGLAPGDLIVERGWTTLGEGMEVRPTRQPTCDGGEE
ncbi:MAG: efflux RND transporter periplasmic adaptor subunit [Bradymonadales bacterium]|nr:efflux RND transporter periplasmic adaptor subunit [Bradymonadales bacterium]